MMRSKFTPTKYKQLDRLIGYYKISACASFAILIAGVSAYNFLPDVEPLLILLSSIVLLGFFNFHVTWPLRDKIHEKVREFLDEGNIDYHSK